MKSNRYKEEFITDTKSRKILLGERRSGRTQALVLDLQDKIREAEKRNLNYIFRIVAPRRDMALQLKERMEEIPNIQNIERNFILTDIDACVIEFDENGNKPNPNLQPFDKSVSYIDNLELFNSMYEFDKIFNEIPSSNYAMTGLLSREDIIQEAVDRHGDSVSKTLNL